MFWPGSGPNVLQRRGARAGTTSPSTPPSPISSAKQQAARVRIRATQARTQGAKARIRAKVQWTQTALARLQATSLQVQTAKGRLQANTLRTQGALGRLRATTQQSQGARIRIGTPNLSVLPRAVPALSVTYNGYVLDERNHIIITSPYDTRDNSVFGEYKVTFRIRLQGTELTGDTARDDALWAQLILTLETQLKTPRQELIVKFGSTVIRDWTFNQATQTAFLIFPELDLVHSSRYDFTYKFHVSCQFPGNIPGNAFRRESNTSVADSLRSRRSVVSTAVWTSSPGVDAYTQYLTHGDDFFTAYLPPNKPDQYGIPGTWLRADENPVSFNDERSICSATRVYWECFKGRRESLEKTISTIGNRRVVEAPSTWMASPTATALQNYLDNGDAFYGKILPAPIGPNASWVLVDEEPAYNDPNGQLVVIRTYHEVVKGLREFNVRVLTNPNQTRQVVVTGSYYETNLSAKINFTNDIDKLISTALAGLTPPMTRFESFSVPKLEGYDTTGRRYFFTHTFNELAYPQGIGTDDPNITISTLMLKTESPFDAQSILNGMQLTRLQHVVADFSAIVNYTRNQDPAGLWKNGLRSYVLNAVATKLGSAVVVDLVNEQVGVGLSGNTLQGTLHLLVTGGSVLWMKITQTLILVPSRNFASRADGTDFSAYPYRDVAEKILIRQAQFEYVLNGAGTPPPVFTSGQSASGFGLIDTGKTAQESFDEQSADGQVIGGAPGWFLDRRAGVPYLNTDVPMTTGVGFQTVMHMQTETWRWLQSLEPGTSIPT